MVHCAQHAASYYAASSAPHPDHAFLQGEHSADVCIVGGGYSGLNTAIELAERGLSVILLEARKLGWGASGRNGGQLIRGVGHGLEQFLPVIGEDGVRSLKLMGLEAVEIVRDRVERHGIDCDLTWGYCDLANKPGELEGFAEEAETLRNLGYRHELRLVQPGDMHSVVGSDRYVGGLVDMGSGHLHPLNLALGEAAVASRLGVRLFEQSEVTRIEYGPEVKVHTAQGRVRAKALVLCCNAYHNDLNRELGGRCCPPAAISLPPSRWARSARASCCRRTWRCATSAWPWITTACPPTTACCSAVPATIPGATRRTSPPTCGRRCSRCSRNWPTCASTTSGAA